MTEKQSRNKIRQDFLMTFFEGDNYQEKEVNGFFLIKQKGETGWNVAVYTQDAYNKSRTFKKCLF